MAITIIGAGLTITLILDSVHGAAILTTVCWHLIGWLSSQNIIPLMIVIVNELAIVDSRRHSTRAEAILNKSMAQFSTILGHLTTALAGAVGISLAFHTFATVGCTVSAARFLVGFVRCGVSRRLGPSLLCGLLGGKASRLTIAAE